LKENNNVQSKELIEQSINSDDTEFKKIGILYTQGMDINNRNEISPGEQCKKYIDNFTNCNSKKELLDIVFDQLILNEFSSPINYYVYNDLTNASTNILYLGTGGIGLPDRDYYFMPDKENTRNEYKKFINEYSSLFDLNLDVESIYNLEEKLAEQSYTRVQRREPELQNNPTTIDKFEIDYNLIPLRKLFVLLNKEPGKINISNPKFYMFFNQILNELSLEVLKNYFIWRFIISVSDYINSSAELVFFNFYTKHLTGTPKMKKLWERIVGNVNDKFGMVVGKLFVKKYFSEESKSTVLKMIEFIKIELRTKLKSNTWMSDETKLTALVKLDKMNYKIGYPDVWRNYTDVDVSTNNNYLVNNINANRFEKLYNLNQMYEPKDSNIWMMNPHMVNAYYSPLYNEIVFPAGILQKPFFDINSDPASNFGAIGAVMGHEMTHGFDDQGCKFDQDGNLNNWWTIQDKQKYTARTDILRKQFDGLKIEGKFLNGRLTLGENIADLGGVSISYYALIQFLKNNPQLDKIINGRTQQQRFFLSYAKIWRCITRKKEIIKRVITDPHSPPIYRVNAILSHFQPFYTAFKINEENELWVDKINRAQIW